MKKITTTSALVLLMFSLLSSCSKESSSSSSGGSNFDRDKQQYEQQKSENEGTNAGKVAKTVGGTAGGAAAGAGAGAGIGAAIGSVIPGAGTVVGAVIGGIVGAVGGGTVAGVNTYSLANGEVSEYINVETHLTYVNNTTHQNLPFAFGSAARKNYVTPKFAKKDKIKLVVEMNANMIPEKSKKASKRQKSFDLLIPVEIQIDKSSIEDGTLSINLENTYRDDSVDVSEIVDSKQIFRFFIKNDPFQTPYVELKFVPAGIGEAKIRIIYGKPDYKIVLSSCDVMQTIEFTDSDEQGE